MQNTSDVHYDIVLDVASCLTPHSNHGCKRKRNNEQIQVNPLLSNKAWKLDRRNICSPSNLFPMLLKSYLLHSSSPRDIKIATWISKHSVTCYHCWKGGCTNAQQIIVWVNSQSLSSYIARQHSLLIVILV